MPRSPRRRFPARLAPRRPNLRLAPLPPGRNIPVGGVVGRSRRLTPRGKVQHADCIHCKNPAPRRDFCAPAENPTAMPDPTTNTSSDWLRPPSDREGLQRYVETLRERLWLIILVVVVTTGIAILYVLTATKMYSAESDLLITPVSGDDPVLSSLGLISASADPTRDVETASRFVTNVEVANAVAKKLGSSESGKDLLHKVTAVPVAGSNIVAVSASSDSPAETKELADAFAAEAVTLQTDQMHEKIAASLERLETQITHETTETETLGREGSASLQSQIAELKVLSTAPNPT